MRYRFCLVSDTQKKRGELYLESETSFFSLLFFTGSQGSKNWRRTPQHDAIFLTNTKNIKTRIGFMFPFRVCFFTSQGDDSSKWFAFLGFSWTLVDAPSQVKLNAQLQLMLEMCSFTGEGKGKILSRKSKILIKGVVSGWWLVPGSLEHYCQ